MKIESFRTLNAVLRGGSCAAGGADMNLSPSAVSLQMKQMEEYFGQPLFDRSALQVAVQGLITEPAAHNPKAIARMSVHYQAQREAEKTTERLEQQLGLTPGRRGRVGKVTKKRERSAGADRFLGPKG